jgi:anti-anti-sigma factor
MKPPKPATGRLSVNAEGGAGATIIVQREGNRLVVCGELDAYSAPRLVAAALGHLRDTDTDTGDVLLDCSSIDFIDVSGLSAMIVVARHAHESGRRFLVSPTSPSLDRLLSFCAMAGVSPALDSNG